MSECFNGRDRMYSADLDVLMREVLHTLGHLDCEHEIQLSRVDRQIADQARREQAKRQINAAHRERRQPYVELLNRLRNWQHQRSFAA